MARRRPGGWRRGGMTSAGSASGRNPTFSTGRSRGPELRDPDHRLAHRAAVQVVDGEPDLVGPPVDVDRAEIGLAEEGAQPVRPGLVRRGVEPGDAAGG